jgi:hypothetical protein
MFYLNRRFDIFGPWARGREGEAKLSNHESQNFSNYDSRHRIHFYYAEYSSGIVALLSLFNLQSKHTDAAGSDFFKISSGRIGSNFDPEKSDA